MRAPQTWTNDCYRTLVMLGSDASADGDSRTSEQRAAERVELFLTHNKVTHIYELVKAFGSSRQIEYDRPAGAWRRRELIERKHSYEASVDPLSGELVRGVAHAPLLYRDDPRTDLPEQLQVRVSDVIRGRDGDIVGGWLRAAGT
jgi:hypothetical protein